MIVNPVRESPRHHLGRGYQPVGRPSVPILRREVRLGRPKRRVLNGWSTEFYVRAAVRAAIITAAVTLLFAIAAVIQTMDERAHEFEHLIDESNRELLMHIEDGLTDRRTTLSSRTICPQNK